MSELSYFILLFVALPAAIGFRMARRRGKNPFLWGMLSGIFPFFLVVLNLQHKPISPSRNIPKNSS
jgi:hypothetical protein